MDVAACGIRPFRGALIGEGIGGISLIGGGGFLRIEVRITRHALAVAVDEELVDGEARRGAGFENAIGLGLPFQVELQAAAEHGFAFVDGMIDDGKFSRSRVRRGEEQGFRQVMHAIGHVNGHGLLAGELAGGITGSGEVIEGRSLRAGVAVLAGGGDVEICGVRGEAAENRERERNVTEFCQRRVNHDCGWIRLGGEECCGNLAVFELSAIA